MSYLLDTCTFIWLLEDGKKLTKTAKNLIDQKSDIFISDVTCLEICLKWKVKKIRLPKTPRLWFEEQVKSWDLINVSIDREHFYRTSELALYHKDPFDRLLISQCLTEDLTLITPDCAFEKYPVSTVW
ncbi:MAG: type II toxin-antitoxin system VapC family toxin [Bdellovibrionales bacterium]|nr:type II toxin-antitoxin system VapC family toxin [Bdellovibrionales bacterium]